MMHTMVTLLLIVSLIGCTSGFTCPDGFGGMYADPENCRIFHHCENRVAHRKFCPPGSLFDGNRLQCVNRHEKVVCGPQPTTERTTTTEDPLSAGDCQPANCKLPDCFCSSDGTQIPGGLKPQETPQMIQVTFDGAINHLNFDTYNTIFTENRTNPNGCPIRGTFFVTHDYSDYSKVQELYSRGHEIAIASISRRQGLHNEGEEEWVGEMVSMREILFNFAGVNPNDVIGMRAPHLLPGRNAQFQVIYDYGFLWDSTMAVPPRRIPVWPYTLDYNYSHDCKSGTCPTKSFPGIWEFPMNSHFEDENYEGGYCPFLDQCVLNIFDEDGVFRWLKKDFHRHYDQNRAPYMMSLSVNWFNSPDLHRALLRFVDYTLTLPEVYYTTVTEALQWTSSPIPVNEMATTADFDCKLKTLPEPPCSLPNSCPLVLGSSKVGVPPGGGGTRYMVTCSKCPIAFPWVYDAKGFGGNHKDTYEKFLFK